VFSRPNVPFGTGRLAGEMGLVVGVKMTFPPKTDPVVKLVLWYNICNSFKQAKIKGKSALLRFQ